MNIIDQVLATTSPKEIRRLLKDIDINSNDFFKSIPKKTRNKFYYHVYRNVELFFEIHGKVIENFCDNAGKSPSFKIERTYSASKHPFQLNESLWVFCEEIEDDEIVGDVLEVNAYDEKYEFTCKNNQIILQLKK